MPKSKTRRTFTPEFKLQAIKLITEQGVGSSESIEYIEAYQTWSAAIPR